MNSTMMFMKNLSRLPASMAQTFTATMRIKQISKKQQVSPALSKRNTLVLIRCCLSIMVLQLAILKALAVKTSTRETGLQDTYRAPLSEDFLEFRNPIVWDTSSLYSHKTTNLNTFADVRQTRQHSNRRTKRSAADQQPHHNQPAGQQQYVDSCPSKMEILTPYYATNAKGRVRTIINSELMQQAIQVETCIRSNQNAGKCNSQPECGCEQKYKWHRLLVLDPNDQAGASKGLFMDWFLFPSNCVCRCKSSPTHNSGKHFLKTMTAATRPKDKP